jgi:uncharacterized cupredoxin-like copper-binding protein
LRSIAAVAAFLLALGAGAGLAAARAPATPARAQVSAGEFRLTLSRVTIHRGPAIIELVNYGEDDHDLALRRAAGTRTYRIALVHPGKTGELDARLRAGRYAVWCTLADHRARGMRATLLVR